MAEALARAGEGCDEVYVTIDFDVLDGGVALGAGSNNIDGVWLGELDAVDVLADAPVGAPRPGRGLASTGRRGIHGSDRRVALTNFICRLLDRDAARAES